jgi:hypothetical protein
MPKLTKNFLLKLIGQRIVGFDFLLQSSTWVRTTPLCKLGINVQRSLYSTEHYINFYAWYDIPETYAFISFPKGTFHLSSRGRSELRDQQSQLLTLDGRDVDALSYSDQIGKLWFDRTFQRLMHYEKLINLTGFNLSHLDDLGFTVEHHLENYLKKNYLPQH